MNSIDLAKGVANGVEQPIRDVSSESGAVVLAAQGLGKTVDSGGSPLAILHDISFSVRAGESVAIVGASGSGKSTLLGLLAGLDSPTTGAVELAGNNLSRLDEDGRARLRASRVGFVFQSFQLLPSLTALENVALPLELGGRANATMVAQRWLGRVGLAERGHHRAKHLHRWRPDQERHLSLSGASSKKRSARRAHRQALLN